MPEARDRGDGQAGSEDGKHDAAPPLAPGLSSGPARRILAIWCRTLAIDRWRMGERLLDQPSERPFAQPSGGDGDDSGDPDALPLALIAETAHGPRITAANPAGLAAGARAGSMLADARTLCPALAVAPADPAGDYARLEELALWARRWAPWSAIDPPDGLIVDVSGAAHLFGGEPALIEDVRACFSRRGFAVRMAIAPTAGAAWALSHHAADGAILAPGDDAAARLSDLPVAALRLDEDTVVLLRRLGLKRVGELAGVARDNLARRFRNRFSPAANPLIRLDQLLGRVPEPLLPVQGREAPMVQRRLMEPIRHRDLLVRVLADLCADLARRLEGAAEGARRLELRMWKVDGEVATRRLELAAASRDGPHLAGLLERRLEDVDAGFGIELVQLRAPWTSPIALTQADMDAAAEAHGTSLAACIDRLVVRLGEDAVRRPVPHASHLPERAQRWQPPLDPVRPIVVPCHSPATTSRPLKLLDRAEPITVIYETPDGLPRQFRWRDRVHIVARAQGPERIAPEWWREKGVTRLRDYYRIEDQDGARYWIFRRGLPGDGRGGAPEWFLQGLCA